MTATRSSSKGGVRGAPVPASGVRSQARSGASMRDGEIALLGKLDFNVRLFQFKLVLKLRFSLKL